MAKIKDLIPEYITIDDAIAMDNEQAHELQLKYLNRVRTQLGAPFYFPKVEGSWFTDYEGNQHLDLVGGVGVTAVGNNNEYVWSELDKVFKSKPYAMGAIAWHPLASSFAHNMAILSPGGQLTKMGTATGGAEAIEGILKLVKLATRNKPEKTHILSTLNSFHGKTTGAVSVGGKDKWRMGQEPMMPNVDYVKYGDADELAAAIRSGKYKAFFMETIQGEGGIIVPPEGYLTKVRELCDETDTIMVLDEIQCGCGRTGKLWACEHENVIPDVIAFAKGFSGGLIPMGGYICKEDIYEAAFGTPETAFHHTGTYHENAMSCAAAAASLTYLLENNLIEEAGKKGDYVIGRLKKMQEKYPEMIKEVRGKGLMIGFESHELPEEHKDLSKNLVYYTSLINAKLVNEYHVRVTNTMNDPSVFRILPALNIDMKDLEYACDSFEKAIDEVWAATH